LLSHHLEALRQDTARSDTSQNPKFYHQKRFSTESGQSGQTIIAAVRQLYVTDQPLS